MVIDAKEDVIENVQIVGGCHGNGQGMCALLKGMRIEDAIGRLSGIDCHGRGTSCPDQMAQALKQLQSMISLYPIPRIFKILIDSSFDNL